MWNISERSGWVGEKWFPRVAQLCRWRSHTGFAEEDWDELERQGRCWFPSLQGGGSTTGHQPAASLSWVGMDEKSLEVKKPISPCPLTMDTSQCLAQGRIWEHMEGRKHCLVCITLLELLFPAASSPPHCSSELYLAQQGGLAWCARSIIIQTGISKATWNARDCAGVRWQFASWSLVLQPAGQQGTAGMVAHQGSQCICASFSPACSLLFPASPKVEIFAWL